MRRKQIISSKNKKISRDDPVQSELNKPIKGHIHSTNKKQKKQKNTNKKNNK